MPIKTISPAGGNWNATTTWVGGVIPVNDDVIVGDANSGNLIWNSNPNFRYVLDMTNYAATMSINALSWTLPSNTQIAPIYTTSTFSSQMTIAYSSVSNTATRNNGNANNTFVFVGSGPFGQFPIISLSQQTQTLTISGTLKADTLIRTNAATTINRDLTTGGTMSVRKYEAFPGGGALMVGTCPIVFDRETGEWMNSTNIFGGFVGNPVLINTTGTFSIVPNSGYSYGFIGIRSGGNFNHIQGNISPTNKNLWISNQNNSTSTIIGVITTLGLSSSGTWSSIHISDTATGTYNGTTANTYSLSSDLFFNELRIQPNNSSGQYIGNSNGWRIITRFLGSGRLKGGYLRGIAMEQSWNFQGTYPTSNGVSYFVPRVVLATGLPTHDFTGIQLYGAPFPAPLGLSPSYCLISSSSGGIKAFIKVNEPISIGVQYLDIDASVGSQITSYFGVVNNSINIVNTNSLPSGGGGERSALYTS